MIRSWKAKVTAFQEAKDLINLLLEELLGSLMTHELAMKQHDEEEGRKKKILAHKSITKGNDEDNSSEEELGDEDLALVIRKFGRFMGKGKPRYRRRNLAKGEPNKEEEKDKDKDKPIYYEWKKPGYYRFDCPNLKKSFKRSKKKKTMVATKSDSEDTSSNEEEVGKTTNLYLMALVDEINFEPNLELHLMSYILFQ